MNEPLGWYWRKDDVDSSAHGPFETREEAIANVCEWYGPANMPARVLVGRCVDPIDEQRIFSEDIYTIIADRFCHLGLDCDISIVSEKEADAALRDWCNRYVRTGYAWVTNDDEEWVELADGGIDK